VHGTPLPADFDLRRLVVFFSNHDQIGNRGLGDRPSVVLPTEKLAIAAALTILGPFTPLIFQGEEWAASTPFQFFADYHSKEVQDACREGRKREFKEFGWSEFYGADVPVPDPISRSTFDNSKLNWGEVGAGEHLRVLEWYRLLLDLRKQYIGDLPLRKSDVVVRTTSDEAGDTLMLSHSGLIIACNFSSTPKSLGVMLAGRTPRIIASYSPQGSAHGFSDPKNHITLAGMLSIMPTSVVVMEVE
jgi:maltooligosyltrehalose trehalohydrolase